KKLHQNYVFFTLNNYSTAITNSWATCNKIWHYANDKSMDFNYYTKRALLMTAYLPSIAYYITDSSNDYHKTDYFITKVIEKILNAAKLKQKIKSIKLDDIPIVRFFFKIKKYILYYRIQKWLRSTADIIQK
ncbi:COQ9 family protein, partial [Orientia tsutsugamushi str. TA763]